MRTVSRSPGGRVGRARPTANRGHLGLVRNIWLRFSTPPYTVLVIFSRFVVVWFFFFFYHFLLSRLLISN